MTKRRVGLDQRVREKSGEIDGKHGNMLIGALRKTHGPSIAEGRRSDKMLKKLAQRRELQVAVRVA